MAQKNTFLVFEHLFDNQKIGLEKPIITQFLDTIYISRLQYYVSNFTNEKKTIENNYFLIAVDTQYHTKKISIENFIPQKKLGFSIGILPKHNQKNNLLKQKGDLDFNKGMFWTWENGYVFFKLEGYFFVNNEKKGFIFHIGSNECFRNIVFDNFIYKKNNTYQIKVNIEKFFPKKTIKEWTNNKGITIMQGEKAKDWADRIPLLFQLE
ncbi:MAG: hypothetical protein EAZ85_10650 [Bacteroidetes bacterium]|nr:MAG: hypothetical protein EAZ85_10650 [Bacteroidota bacterium]